MTDLLICYHSLTALPNMKRLQLFQKIFKTSFKTDDIKIKSLSDLFIGYDENFINNLIIKKFGGLEKIS
jgi:hypothetical protein